MINDQIQEVILVGLPGPTHHYGGLSADNIAATQNRGSESNPRLAAHQALELVRLLRGLGIVAGLLPPQLRPHLPLLRERFSGTDDEVIVKAGSEAPQLLEQASSSSFMWTANAATVTPSCDSTDGILHITPANLYTNVHRRIEAAATHRVLAAIFADVPDCIVHPPLDAGLRDEGAANHMRLGHRHIFVYGEGGTARQMLAASQAIAVQHHIDGAVFLRQHPDIIAQGVFHNDVIAVSNDNVLLAHECAYIGGRDDILRIAPEAIIISQAELSVPEAVKSYFFNSQIIARPDGGMTVIAPIEVETLFGGKGALLMEKIRADKNNPIDSVHYADLRQSMRNGGGPACLRLRVQVTGEQLAALRARGGVLVDEALLAKVEKLIDAHYPESLWPAGLADPALYHANRALLAGLGDVMKLPLL